MEPEPSGHGQIDEVIAVAEAGQYVEEILSADAEARSGEGGSAESRWHRTTGQADRHRHRCRTGARNHEHITGVEVQPNMLGRFCLQVRAQIRPSPYYLDLVLRMRRPRVGVSRRLARTGCCKRSTLPSRSRVRPAMSRRAAAPRL